MRLIGNAVRICSSPLYCECLCGSGVAAQGPTVFCNATGELPGRRILKKPGDLPYSVKPLFSVEKSCVIVENIKVFRRDTIIEKRRGPCFFVFIIGRFEKTKMRGKLR